MRTAAILLLVLHLPVQAQEGRNKSRLLYSFEESGDLADLKRSAENSTLDVVADNGVTHGKSCARWVIKKGADYGSVEFGSAGRKGWADFDYFAIDVFMEEGGPAVLHFELWDPLTRGYPTRFTQEQRLRAGRQTLLFQISRPKRNGKEGRDWEELEPKDKIDLARLTKVKFFLTPPKDRDAVLWIDNLRLLQEDAAKPKLKVPLPKGAIAYKFGSAGEKIDGFTTVGPGSKLLAGKGVIHGGTGWPDALSGTFVMAGDGEKLSFTAAVPNGVYAAYIIAAPIHRDSQKVRRFRLSINTSVLFDQQPSSSEYHSEKHLYRFLRVNHDGDPRRLWDDYISGMYHSHVQEFKVLDGKARLEALDCFVSALVLIPGEPSARDTEAIDRVRREAFEKTLPPVKRDWPSRARGDAGAIAWAPADGERVWPWTHPKREKAAVSLAAAPGQAVHFRLGLTTFLAGELKLSLDLAGMKTAILDQRLRFDGEDASEMCLVPAAKVMAREARTHGLWFRVEVPADAKPGKIEGNVRVEGKGVSVKVPVTLEVLPIKLDEVLPLSLGMYFSPRMLGGLLPSQNRERFKGQFRFMRSLGMTAAAIGSGNVTGLGRDGKTNITFDPTYFDLAREVGFGKHPMQYQMGTTLSMGRAIGRRMPGSIGAKVDQNPGIELKQPGFRAHFLDALTQYKAFIERQKLPVAVEIVDEPREVPNPWNRNLSDTIAYARMVKEAGLTGFVTPMGDTNAGKDYSVLADEAAIISVHGGKGSAKLMARAAEKKRALWLYNTGMDRFSWGFFAWRVGAVGRWEWHFSWPEDQAKGGYSGREWFNPFTSSHGLACDAPLSLPGGILHQSAFFEVAEGITDHAYLLTLERLVAGKDTPAAKEARAFLAALKKAIPMYPEIKGLADADAGALVGMGIKDDARQHAAKWRAKLAEHIAAVSR